MSTEVPPCFLQVYHVSSDSYETQNQHYGRSLTKETVKDGKGICVPECGALIQTTNKKATVIRLFGGDSYFKLVIN